MCTGSCPGLFAGDVMTASTDGMMQDCRVPGKQKRLDKRRPWLSSEALACPAQASSDRFHPTAFAPDFYCVSDSPHAGASRDGMTGPDASVVTCLAFSIASASFFVAHSSFHRCFLSPLHKSHSSLTPEHYLSTT